ncbi:cupin domain-containing protein [Hyphomicrobium sp. LHD-15]|uniref:cupin domain-containing protein n=1 Tax=Hyphomicrobium sp. LHD-15 TaxID=3072142 RepID=UPI00280E4D15|nr:cupin domain-containing protein [Hyphomicrobium sp. LHD-15]MDQ8697435.1 cupin domain-containing protein [Hyphomicrobium sp. LHD-15]
MTRFVRLSPHGAGQLEDWGPMPSDDLIAGKGQQFGHLWLDDPVCGLMVGVWSCSPMTGKMGPWSTNEVMMLIEGSVAIDHADGTSLDVSAGEAFFIPKGTVCSWRQAGNLKKFFVIHSDSSGLVAPDAAQLKARKIDLSAPLSPTDGPDASLLSGAAPTCHENTAFTDLTGQLTAGIWSATPYLRTSVPASRHELMHILEGETTLIDGSGQSETFAAGDTVFVPLGAVTGWSSTQPVRKIFCSFTPAA